MEFKLRSYLIKYYEQYFLFYFIEALEHFDVESRFVEPFRDVRYDCSLASIKKRNRFVNSKLSFICRKKMTLLIVGRCGVRYKWSIQRNNCRVMQGSGHFFPLENSSPLHITDSFSIQTTYGRGSRWAFMKLQASIKKPKYRSYSWVHVIRIPVTGVSIRGRKSRRSPRFVFDGRGPFVATRPSTD